MIVLVRCASGVQSNPGVSVTLNRPRVLSHFTESRPSYFSAGEFATTATADANGLGGAGYVDVDGDVGNIGWEHAMANSDGGSLDSGRIGHYAASGLDEPAQDVSADACDDVDAYTSGGISVASAFLGGDDGDKYKSPELKTTAANSTKGSDHHAYHATSGLPGGATLGVNLGDALGDHSRTSPDGVDDGVHAGMRSEPPTAGVAAVGDDAGDSTLAHVMDERALDGASGGADGDGSKASVWSTAAAGDREGESTSPYPVLPSADTEFDDPPTVVMPLSNLVPHAIEGTNADVHDDFADELASLQAWSLPEDTPALCAPGVPYAGARDIGANRSPTSHASIGLGALEGTEDDEVAFAAQAQSAVSTPGARSSYEGLAGGGDAPPEDCQSTAVHVAAAAVGAFSSEVPADDATTLAPATPAESTEGLSPKLTRAAKLEARRRRLAELKASRASKASDSEPVENSNGASGNSVDFMPE